MTAFKSYNSNKPPLLTKLAHNIAAHGLLQIDRPVIVGVSGGADSLALLAGLVRLGYECIAVHCNYHLRGEESNRDMRHTQAICGALGVDLYVRDFDVETRRRLTGESVEMACRELRYQWMHDLLDRRRAQAIAVAHHREDNIETFLLNLMRGSSIAGLTGMRWRNGYVVRPLLDATRDEIESFLARQGISWVDDSTNAQSDFARNRLRNIIIPAIEHNFPGATQGILDSIALLGQNREFYDHAMTLRREKYLIDGKIALAQLKKSEPQASLVLYEILKPYGFNMTHVHNILNDNVHSGARFTAGDTTLEVDRGLLSILPSGNDAPKQYAYPASLARDILSPLHIRVTQHPITDFKPQKDPNTAYFDINILLGNPDFHIRHWQRGDRMAPFGMDGTKLVSDLFADAKFSAQQKRDAWLLLRGDEIIWIIGLRQSRRFSIVPDTKRYLQAVLSTNN